MGGLMTATEVFEKARAAAVAATGPDERALQIDYPALKAQIQAALGDRKATGLAQSLAEDHGSRDSHVERAQHGGLADPGWPFEDDAEPGWRNAIRNSTKSSGSTNVSVGTPEGLNTSPRSRSRSLAFRGGTGPPGS